jgi:hypothetical protein
MGSWMVILRVSVRFKSHLFRGRGPEELLN